jgi:hypothetical protein
MDDIDGVLNCSGLKYKIYKIFDTFWLINIDGDQKKIIKDCIKD